MSQKAFSKPAQRDIANFSSEASPQVASEARANIAAFFHTNGPAVMGYSNQSGEGDIRHANIDADLVEYMVALRGQFVKNFGSN